MDFLVWGDDWGKHPSTTQHLIHNLAGDDRVVWVDSIGLRRPRLVRRDLSRIWQKLTAVFSHNYTAENSNDEEGGITRKPRCNFKQLSPLCLPLHKWRLVRFVNRILLRLQVGRAVVREGLADVVVLSANPVVVYYLSATPLTSLIYLRLDDYPLLPGVDPGITARAEELMFERADLIVYTARKLLPEGTSAKSLYLPQGVDIDNFALASLVPPGKPILGFFGLLAEWLDYDLILAVAKILPNWTFEFLGPIRSVPNEILTQPNINVRGSVEYEELSGAIRDWACGWVPFTVTTLTDSANPLKLREYLAAGLPAICTPLQEIVDDDLLREQVFVSEDPAVIAYWLEKTLATDSAEKREQRLQAMRQESWRARVQTLKEHELLRSALRTSRN